MEIMSGWWCCVWEGEGFSKGGGKGVRQIQKTVTVGYEEGGVGSEDFGRLRSL